MTKTSDKQFKEFTAEVYKLQKEWGLTDWKIFCEHRKLKDRFASNNYEMKQRVSMIAFTTELENDGDIEFVNPKLHAKHEMVHLLIADLYALAGERYINEFQIDSAEEGIVRRLEKLL